MSWVHFRKHFYAPLLVVVFGGALAAIWVAPEERRLTVVLIASLALLAPGFLGRMVLSDLLASRAFINRREYEQGLVAAQRFLSDLRRRPWIRHAIWTQYGVYTLSVEAMASNNAGAALLELGRLVEARVMLERALTADPAYPIPLYNLAVIAKLQGEETQSQRLISEAAARGFAGGQLHAVVQAVGEAYARLATPRSNA